MADTASVLRDLTHPLPEGTVIQERYKLLKAVGQGGFGITYIGWDKELRRNVAVKECFPVGLCYRDGLQLCPLNPQVEPYYLKALDDMMREAQTLAALQHDRVVKVYDVVGGNGSIFCVMQWLQGGSLRERLAARETALITPEQAAEWLAALLQALVYLHAHGVIHRDLKPENILFDEAGLPVIVDFGAALNKPQLTTTATRGAFSPGYAAPEQLTGKGEIGPWTDLFSLSATWYELLTGIRPETADKRLMEDDLIPLTAAKLLVPTPRSVLEMLQTNLSLHPARRSKRAADCLFWLRRGHAPHPLSAFLYRAALPLILTAAALGAVAAWLMLPKDSPAGTPAPQTPEEKQEEVNDATAALDKKLRRLYKVDECLADLQQIEPKMQVIKAKLCEAEEKRCQRLLAEMDSPKFLDAHAFSEPYTESDDDEEEDGTPAEEEAPSFIASFLDRLTSESSEIDRLLHRERSKLETDLLAKYARTGLGNLAQEYHPADFREAALLPHVASQIDREFQYAWFEFSTALKEYPVSVSGCGKEYRKRAIKKWNEMAARDAAAKPQELHALIKKIRTAAKADEAQKARKEFYRRYAAALERLQQSEKELLKNYRESRARLTTEEERSDCRQELEGALMELRLEAEAEINRAENACAENDVRLRNAVKNGYKPTDAREKKLYAEALAAVLKVAESCGCQSWTHPQIPPHLNDD